MLLQLLKSIFFRLGICDPLRPRRRLSKLLESTGLLHQVSRSDLMTGGADYNDFTEDAYARHLENAREHWSFALFSEAPHAGRVILWRHDVDLSPQRALKLAQLEADFGVRSTYFLHLHSSFYNLLESSVTVIFRKIASLGHEIGLHFDPGFYGAALQTREQLEGFLRLEAGLLGSVFDLRVKAFSFHNPDVGPWLSYDDDMIAGLHNAYGKGIKSTFRYVSDSNGYWRFDCLQDTLADTSIEKLHVLTHPVWWQHEALSPRQRVMRSIDGRAKAVWAEYEKLLSDNGRINLG